MNDRPNGLAFEQRAYRLLTSLIADERLGLIPHCSEVFHHKAYFSADRQAEIEFDVVVEVTLPGATVPSFLWLWECKQYSRAVPVDDLEEFNSKIQQVAQAEIWWPNPYGVA